jgi:lysozyme
MTPHGLALLKAWEGGRLTAYQDGGGIWTIGYGHVGPDVHERLTLSLREIDALLEKDVAKAEAAVDRLVDVPLTAGQHDALTCFVFNVGGRAFEDSTLLRLLNAGDYDAVPGQLLRWVKDNGRDVPGLVNRRKGECLLWSSK